MLFRSYTAGYVVYHPSGSNKRVAYFKKGDFKNLIEQGDYSIINKSEIPSKMSEGGAVEEVPNTVAEYNKKMAEFSKRLNTAESLWKMDDGKAYKKIIAERDAYYELTKKYWFKALNEAEKTSSDKYNIIKNMLKQINMFAKGGSIGSSFEYSIGGL